jgi:hypothetical protein
LLIRLLPDLLDRCESLRLFATSLESADAVEGDKLGIEFRELSLEFLLGEGSHGGCW